MLTEVVQMTAGDEDGFTKVIHGKKANRIKKLNNRKSSGGENSAPRTPELEQSQRQPPMNPRKEIVNFPPPTGIDKSYEQVVEWALNLQDEMTLDEIRLHIGNRVSVLHDDIPRHRQLAIFGGNPRE